MAAASLPDDEDARLQALRSLGILDTPPEPAFDDLTLLASLLCNAPAALLGFVDADRQWFKSRRGLELAQAPREHAFCAHAILDPERILEVGDAAADPRFRDNTFVTGGPRIRFYAGAPLVTGQGHALGTLCVIDRVPRKLEARQSDALRALARQAMLLLDLRTAREELRLAREQARNQEAALEEYQFKLDRINSQLRAQSVNDALTGLCDRPAFMQALSQAVAHSSRYGDPLSLIFIDIDRFRALNDTFGHLAGDEALRRIADIVRESSRKADTASRYGGEEFAVILPSTDGNGAMVLAERIRRQVETSQWPHRKVTISIGVVTRAGTDPRCDAQHLIADADAALHRAKTGGRNRVYVA